MSVSPQKCSAGTFQLDIATLLPAFERPMMVVSNGGMAIFPVEASVSTQSPGSPLNSSMWNRLATTKCDPGALMCTRGFATCPPEASSEV